MELFWALMVNVDDAAYPARSERFAEAPAMAERIEAFWGDGIEFAELILLAERAGVLFEQDMDRVWVGLAAAASLAPGFEPLTSENEANKACFRARLARLHEDPALLADWLDLLRDVWAVIGPQWDNVGCDEVEANVWRIEAKLPAVGSYSDMQSLVGPNDCHGVLPRVVGETAMAGQEVLVVPSWLGRKGYFVTLANRLLWAPTTYPHPAGPTEETRQRARIFKALGDPTRLAIFETTAHRPRTVGELASELGVAQPTVSNHVRLLRDSGLLQQEQGGGRRLRPDLDAFERFLRSSRSAVVRSTAT
jgi:DNA-binding transcriptional ArsR family regulator